MRFPSALILILSIFCCIPINAQEEAVSWREALSQNGEWYSGNEAKRIGDNVLLFQRENGGWVKNLDMAVKMDKVEQDKLKKLKTSNLGTTIDNNATFTQIRFLGRVYRSTGDKRYKDGFIKGLDYLLEAQHENGGWPQFYPLRGGYYDHITFNDGAMIGVMQLLQDISEENESFDFVDAERKKDINRALEKGVDIILKTQVKVDGKLTVWCAQHDKETLKPAKARAYELPSLSGGESVGIVSYLMQLKNPDPMLINAIECAISWFEDSKITGKKVEWIVDKSRDDNRDRIVIDDENAGPLWARFYEIETNKPMFVGRDGKIKVKLSEIERERRVGYSYLKNYAQELLEKEYPEWKKRINKGSH